MTDILIKSLKETWRECQMNVKVAITGQGERPGMDPSLKALRRNHPCQHLDFRP